MWTIITANTIESASIASTCTKHAAARTFLNTEQWTHTDTHSSKCNAVCYCMLTLLTVSFFATHSPFHLLAFVNAFEILVARTMIVRACSMSMVLFYEMSACQFSCFYFTCAPFFFLRCCCCRFFPFMMAIASKKTSNSTELKTESCVILF